MTVASRRSGFGGFEFLARGAQQRSRARVGSSGGATVRAVLLPSLVFAAACFLATSPVSAQTQITAGFKDFSYGTTVNATPTAEKPESKIWWNDGIWWGSLFSASANQYRIHRFNLATHTWIDTGTALDTRTSSRADVLWDGATGRLYVVSHIYSSSPDATTSTSQWGRLFRYSYDSSTKQYRLESGFPVAVTRGKAEALTIAKDSTGRLWVTHVETGKVKINWSRAHDLDWGVPIDLPVGAVGTATEDDLSAVTAFDGKIGVMWSNQRTNVTYFAYRHDTDLPDVWQAPETALAGGNCGTACADDHLNLKVDRNGRVLAAVKTSVGTATSPLVMLVVRSATGTWSRYTVGLKSDHHTRPVLVLDDGANRAYVFSTSPETYGAIYMKSSPLGSIAFPSGVGTPFIKSSIDVRINNATSTKQNVSASTGLLVVASDENARTYFHNFLALGTAPAAPAAPTNLAAIAASSGRVNLSWADNSSNETAFRIERSAAGGTYAVIATATANATSYSDQTVSPATTYTYRVRAENSGVFSAYSNTASATTPSTAATPPAAPINLSASAVASTQVSLTWTDQSNNETGFRIERATGSGSFVQVGTSGAGVTNYTDATVVASTTYTYRVKAENAGVFSAYSNTDQVTTPSGGVSTSIKNITFEGASLTSATTGADSVVGTVTLESAGPLIGLYSARIANAGNAYLQESFGAVDDLYLSLYVRVAALPASEVRLVQITNAGTTVTSLVLGTNGTLRLSALGTRIGNASAPLAVGGLYRIAIHQLRGTGANATMEAYVVPAGAALSSPFAAMSTGTWTTAADRVRIGATTATAVNAIVDDIRLDAAAMPPGSFQ